MAVKRFFLIFVTLAVLFSMTAANRESALAQTDLKNRARIFLAQEKGVDANSLKEVGKVGKVKYPLQGLVVYEYKFMDANGTNTSIAVTASGKKANISTLDAKEARKYEAKYGKMDPALVRALSGANPRDMVEVDVWLRVADSNSEAANVKPEVDGGANQQAFESRAEGERFARESDKAEAAFNTEAWGAMESAVSENASLRNEDVTVPFADAMRAQGYEAVPSSAAPVVNVVMPVWMIREYAKNAGVEGIYLSGKPEQEMNIARQVVGANTVNSRGYTGSGSRVAVIEYGGMVSSTNPYLSGITRDNLYGCSVHYHVTGIAGIIRSTHSTRRGVAPATILRVGCGNSDAQLKTMTNRANNWGADTFSLSWFSSVTRTPTSMDKFYDNFMYQHWDLVTKSAGNRGTGDGWVTPPGLGYNTLTVGNFDDKNTVSTSGDTMAPSSSYVDPLSSHNDREKPEVAAPGTNILSTTTSSPWTGNIGTGTSYSGPIVAGISSLMYQRNAALKTWPESTKAIIMATAIKNKEGASRLSEKDGAGGVWAPSADTVARNNTIFGRWGGRTYNCSTGTNLNVTSMYLYAGYKTRVVIVWDQNPNYGLYASKPSADLDLQIWRGTTLITGSYSWDNTYEIVEFTPTVTGYYTLQVDKVSCYATPAFLGWAWSQP